MRLTFSCKNTHESAAELLTFCVYDEKINIYEYDFKNIFWGFGIDDRYQLPATISFYKLQNWYNGSQNFYINLVQPIQGIKREPSAGFTKLNRSTQKYEFY